MTLPNLSPNKQAHLIGICGVGMSATARLLLDQGWRVTGSDEGFYPPFSDYLREQGIPCAPRHDPANIPAHVDLFVVGKHAKLRPETNPEVRAAFARGVPVQSFPEVLRALTAGRQNAVVAGSFGKSTCTALAAWTLAHAGKDPGYFIGALARNFPATSRLGSGRFFVLEGDEYPSANWDPTSKFLYYNAQTVLLISCEPDHVNVFPTPESYWAPFVQLLAQTPGVITACLAGRDVPEVLRRGGRTAVTYALDHPQAEWQAGAIQRGAGTAFELRHRGRAVARIESCLLGDHNVENMVGVAAWLLSNEAVTVAEVAEGFRTFEGVRRRMELRTRQTVVPVYEDFGSSRAKALAGLRTLRRQFPARRLLVVFEPHTFSFRNRAALGWYEDLFADASHVFIFQPPTHGADTHDQLSQAEIVAAVARAGRPAEGVGSGAALLARLDPMLARGDVVLMITSGHLDGAIGTVAALADARFAGAPG